MRPVAANVLDCFQAKLPLKINKRSTFTKDQLQYTEIHSDTHEVLQEIKDKLSGIKKGYAITRNSVLQIYLT